MGKHGRYWQNLKKQEDNVSAAITAKLHALFQTRYKEDRKNNPKSKDKGGYDDKKKRIKRTSPHSMEAIKKEIRLLLAYYGVGSPHTELKNQPPLSREQISMMNMDYDGVYFIPDRKDMSETYKMARDMNAGKTGTKYKPKDYNLDDIPIWEEMKKYKSFQLMARPIRYQLSIISFLPERLPYLKYEDLIDLIARHSHDHHDQKMVGQKQRFLKMFAACYGKEFMERESLLGHGKEAKDYLTYISYLNKQKLCPESVKYTSEYYTVHHRKNRQFASELESPAEVNNFRYLTLTRNFPHHKVLHSPQNIDLNPNIIFFGSFLSEFQITRDPQREKLYANGQNKNSTTKSKEL